MTQRIFCLIRRSLLFLATSAMVGAPFCQAIDLTPPESYAWGEIAQHISALVKAGQNAPLVSLHAAIEEITQDFVRPLETTERRNLLLRMFRLGACGTSVDLGECPELPAEFYGSLALISLGLLVPLQTEEEYAEAAMQMISPVRALNGVTIADAVSPLFDQMGGSRPALRGLKIALNRLTEPRYRYTHKSGPDKFLLMKIQGLILRGAPRGSGELTELFKGLRPEPPSAGVLVLPVSPWKELFWKCIAALRRKL